MKKLISTIAVIFLVATNSIFAESDRIKENFGAIENNLIMGIESGNDGLTISSAEYLGYMGSEKAVIKLMALTRAGNNDEIRIAAATALKNIGSSKGMYQVKEMTKEKMSDELRFEFNRLWHEYNTNS